LVGVHRGFHFFVAFLYLRCMLLVYWHSLFHNWLRYSQQWLADVSAKLAVIIRHVGSNTIMHITHCCTDDVDSVLTVLQSVVSMASFSASFLTCD
jgi:hypothetical protein